MEAFTPTVKKHGGKRKGSGRRPGPRKRRKRHHRRSSLSEYRKFQMRDNKKNHKVDEARRKQLELQEENERLNGIVNDIYNRFGELLERDRIMDILRLQDARMVMDNKDEFIVLQFNILLHLLYKSRVSFTNIYSTVVGILSIMWKVDEGEIRNKVLSSSTMIRWGKYRANYIGKLSLSLLMAVSLPTTDITFKNDGTERNKDNLMGHVLEFQFPESKKKTFKTLTWNNKSIGIEYFSSYERTKNVSRIVFSYNQSIGKTAESLKVCTDESMEDLDSFMNIWREDELQRVLISEFGEDNINLDTVRDRVTAFTHDRHTV